MTRHPHVIAKKKCPCVNCTVMISERLTMCEPHWERVLPVVRHTILRGKWTDRRTAIRVAVEEIAREEGFCE